MMCTGKVLLIDQSDIPYFRMFSKYGQEAMDMTVVTMYGSSNPNALQYFYKFSRAMKRGLFRKVVRGFEYIWAYLRIFRLIKRTTFDVIHVQWAVIPKLDISFFKILKKYTNKLVFTAHDVVPHIKSDEMMKLNERLYEIPDKIIVHGDYCKKEMEDYFPRAAHKVYIQYHGVQDKTKVDVSKDVYIKHKKLLSMISENTIVFSFIGQINYYKGIDILVEAWEQVSPSNAVLLIVGKTIEKYEAEFKPYRERIKRKNNIYIYNQKFSDEEESFFFNLSDVLVLPYRTASMSGVLFTAAQYEKTVISTEVGCLEEYLSGCKNMVYTCAATVEGFEEKMQKIIGKTNCKIELEQFGVNFSNYIYHMYNWEKIMQRLKRECYEFE